ncbi:putative DNA modification/repair radical SAM protein [Chondromyces apiculatus]|uniref:Biotin synthase related domain containing protein n=1 Tax=Chondromyces apiculatus DSM 436 TaxID=1192034 RepID=A0A017SWQ6_9BACT|nr:putative DNA modification/repair radical SAM protein [Chondromyces apiculatus]EYF01403.1 Biotin synthase related domain containing protein [Chondromyces apiculatus DSM 436]
MDLRAKLTILADAAKYDASCSSSGSRRKGDRNGLGNSEGIGICHSYTPDGRCVSLLKILFTNHCIYDCQYCINRVSSDTPRARFVPSEVVALTLDFYRRNYIEGLFLSSGVIRSADYTMEQMAEVARSLREDHGFRGYIHLKAVPGASPELIERAGLHADRLSANLELPTQPDLDRLAPDKQIVTVEQTMRHIHARREQAEEERRGSQRAPTFVPAGQTTQLIVGATASPDAAYLAAADRLYKNHGLRRVYYSAYSPIPRPDARLPAKSPPLWREHRLYQADWLMRHYGFSASELTTPDAPDLPLDHDPKLAWALRHRALFPLDLNTAAREALLRVPGLGVHSVDRILAARRVRPLRVDDLARLGASVRKVRPFVTALGPNPEAHTLDRVDLQARLVPARQLDLFAAPTPRVVTPDPAASRLLVPVPDALPGALPTAGPALGRLT